MKKRIYTIFLLAAIIVLSVTASALMKFMPHSIISESDTVEIIRVTYNPDFGKGADKIEITDFNDELLKVCLNRYTEQKTLNTATAYSMNDVEFEITANVNNELKCIYLGQENYSCGGHGTPKYKIIQADKMKSELHQIFKQ